MRNSISLSLVSVCFYHCPQHVCERKMAIFIVLVVNNVYTGRINIKCKTGRSIQFLVVGGGYFSQQ